MNRIQYEQIKYPRFIIPQNSWLRKSWDILIIMLIFLQVVYIPYQISFNDNADLLTYLDYLIVCIFILDIVVNFRTTYYQTSSLEIVNPKKISYHYFMSLNFYIDLLTSIPISEFFAYQTSYKKSLRIINLIKFVRVIKF